MGIEVQLVHCYRHSCGLDLFHGGHRAGVGGAGLGAGLLLEHFLGHGTPRCSNWPPRRGLRMVVFILRLVVWEIVPVPLLYSVMSLHIGPVDTESLVQGSRL